MKIKRVLKRSVLVILVTLTAWIFIVYWTSTNDCGRKIAPGREMIRAIRYCEYGPPDDVLKLEEVEKPVPNDDQILVRSARFDEERRNRARSDQNLSA